MTGGLVRHILAFVAGTLVSLALFGRPMATSAPNYTVVRFSSCALSKRGRGKAIEELCKLGPLAAIEPV